MERSLLARNCVAALAVILLVSIPFVDPRALLAMAILLVAAALGWAFLPGTHAPSEPIAVPDAEQARV